MQYIDQGQNVNNVNYSLTVIIITITLHVSSWFVI